MLRQPFDPAVGALGWDSGDYRLKKLRRSTPSSGPKATATIQIRAKITATSRTTNDETDPDPDPDKD
jgi:hypothetical protein